MTFNGLRHPFTMLAATFFVVASLVSAGITPAKADKAAGDTPEAFVQNVADEVITIVRNPDLTLGQKQKQFLALFDDNADVKRIAIFALGQYARLPTPEQREEYLELVRQFVAEVYVRRLNEYSGETIDVKSHSSKGKNTLVQSSLSGGTLSEPVAVEWWLLNDDDGGYKVFDLNVAGIWLAQEQRAQFTSIIGNNGGKFEALLSHLRKQITLAERD